MNYYVFERLMANVPIWIVDAGTLEMMNVIY
jgi:hypothetical protein